MSIRTGPAFSEPVAGPWTAPGPPPDRPPPARPEPRPGRDRPTTMSSQTITRGTALAAAALLLGGAFMVGTAYSAHEADAAPAAPTPTTAVSPGGTTAGITVTGTADVAGTPDTLVLDLAVTAKGSTVNKALDQANSATKKVQDSLRHNGVGAKDLQTTDLQIQPEYSYPSNGTPVLQGYTVSEGITARLRDLGKAGSAISEAASAGGNAVRINGIQLDLSDTSKLVAAARDKAMADAGTKAEQYAKAAGRSLGQVVSVTENVSEPPPVDYSMRPAAGAADALKSVPIQPGSQHVGVHVTVVYAFG
jgi:uncharacterized protein